ncbi:hypothetical protein [Micromonospora sp. U21]|uniref:hypothetical protein n=1 Tax=Micromonospora sp. U21 TaxID=2824899 RepID=UPI001B35F172|nr:hypothetical protein [Micromonospora sp. U21]MBQ0906743.1 hypothetical protein [Micromonospora sp. U21]
MLCGGGLAETEAYLLADGSDDAARALDHLQCSEDAGDFADFSVEDQASSYADYYRA